jgi:hypothetical protein
MIVHSLPKLARAAQRGHNVTRAGDDSGVSECILRGASCALRRGVSGKTDEQARGVSHSHKVHRAHHVQRAGTHAARIYCEMTSTGLPIQFSRILQINDSTPISNEKAGECKGGQEDAATLGHNLAVTSRTRSQRKDGRRRSGAMLGKETTESLPPAAATCRVRVVNTTFEAGAHAPRRHVGAAKASLRLCVTCDV